MPHRYPAFAPLAAALALLATALALPVAAQSPAARPSSPPGPPGPSDAAASVPALRYQPAFADFKAPAEQPVGDWKQANQRTLQIGGWRSYARQASEPAADAASAPAGASGAKPIGATPGGHRHHKSPAEAQR